MEAVKVTRLGQSEMGIHFTDVLVGILTAQTYSYYRGSEDGKMLKALVGCLWILSLANSVLNWHGLYEATITRFGDPAAADSMRILTLNAVPCVLNALLGPPVQMFFARRIQQFSQTRCIPYTCYLGSSIYLILGIASGVGVFLSETIFDWKRNWRSVYTARFILGAVMDVIITTTLCYYLIVNRKNAFEKTVKLIDKLIIWTIATGLVTSVFAVIAAITFLAAFDTYQYIVWDMVMVRLFPISLLAALQFRDTLRAQAMQTTTYSADIRPTLVFREAQTTSFGIKSATSDTSRVVIDVVIEENIKR